VSRDDPTLDYRTLSVELLRALRGGRSQSGFARRLGYRSNVVHAWESGRSFPTAARALEAAERVGADVAGACRALHRELPEAVSGSWASRPGVAQWLSSLRRGAKLRELSERSGRNRFQISRWLAGTAEPRLPDFLCLIEALSFRLVDFLAALVPPGQLPSIAERHRALHEARRATYREPWSQAVLRVLETERYRALPAHDGALVGRWLGIDAARVERSVDALIVTGQARRTGPRYEPTHDSPTLDTRQDPAAARALREHWSEVALERQRAGAEGLFSHALIGVSEADLEQLRSLQKDYYQKVRAVVARSAPVERVALLNLSLVRLD
jgi:transcriptional regulator with XRE-family HTH domain